MECRATNLPLLALIISACTLKIAGRRHCAALVDDPKSLFRQSRNYTEPLEHHFVTELGECTDICCQEESSCNVGVFQELAPTDNNCWLYSCHPLGSCSIKIHKDAQVFVNQDSTEVTNLSPSQDDGNHESETSTSETSTSETSTSETSDVSDYVTNIYNGNDNSNPNIVTDTTNFNDKIPNDDNKQTDDEEIYDILPTFSSNTTLTSSLATFHLSTETFSAPLSEALSPVSLISDNRISVSSVNEVFESVTFMTPTEEDSTAKDTFTTSFNENSLRNTTNATELNENIDISDTFVSSFSKENDTEMTPKYNDRNGNNTTTPSLNNTAYGNDTLSVLNKGDNTFGNDTILAINQHFGHNFSVNLSTPGFASSPALGTSYPTYYTIQPSLSPQDDNYAITFSIDMSFNSYLQTKAAVSPSSRWEANLFSSAPELLQTATELTLQEALASRKLLASVIEEKISSDVSVFLGATEGSIIDRPTTAHTLQVFPQTSFLTPDASVAYEDLYQNAHNAANLSTAAHGSHLSAATNVLLITALSIGCICTLTVLTILGTRLYDCYRKRHYSRLDYLINGMYN